MARVSILDRLTARAAKFHAEGVTRRFRKALASARETQARLLREILAASAESTFGHRHDFGRIRTYEDFTARVPVKERCAGFAYRYRDKNLDVVIVKQSAAGRLSSAANAA